MTYVRNTFHFKLVGSFDDMSSDKIELRDKLFISKYHIMFLHVIINYNIQSVI